MNEYQNITSEQLIRTALNRYKTQHESADMLLSNVIHDMNPGSDSATVIRQAVTNSVAEGIRRMERQALSAESEFQRIGQMSLLGELIPDHKIPASMQSKSAREVNAWMENRAQVERENLEELRAAVEKQQGKTKRFEEWANATRLVCEALEHSGLNPSEVTYAEAVNKAEAVYRRDGADAVASAKRPVR